MRYILLTVAAVFVWISGAQASSCYTQAEAEAEQGIRIHSELMVIGLNCTHMGKRIGWDLYGDYRKFTAKNGNLFASYDNALVEYFRRRGDKNPESSLNTLRTNFANKISNDVAGMRPDVFCANNAQRMNAVTKLSEADIRKWASTFYPSHPVSRPICAGGK